MPIDTSLEFVPINIAVITISDSRTKENDTSGDTCLLYTSPSPRDRYISRMPSSA